MNRNDRQPPGTFDELRALIAERHGQLSARLRDIAEFSLAHPEEVALETVATLARRAGAPPSALVRFAQALGFEGFSQMQRVFRDRLVTRIPSYAERIRRAGQPDSGRAPPLQAFAEATIQAIGRLRAELSEQVLEQGAELLAAADTIHLVGQRRSFPVVAYLAYALAHLGCRAHLLDGIGGMLGQQTDAMRSGDVLLASSFKPYARETLDVVEQAVELGIPVVAVTDLPLSPLARLGRVILPVEDAEVQGVRGLPAAMSVASALVLALGRRLVSDNDARPAAIVENARSTT